MRWYVWLVSYFLHSSDFDQKLVFASIHVAIRILPISKLNVSWALYRLRTSIQEFNKRSIDLNRGQRHSVPQFLLKFQKMILTLSPRSMNFTATSSFVVLSLISLAMPKLPLPMSRICTSHNRAEYLTSPHQRKVERLLVNVSHQCVLLLYSRSEMVGLHVGVRLSQKVHDYPETFSLLPCLLGLCIYGVIVSTPLIRRWERPITKVREAPLAAGSRRQREPRTDMQMKVVIWIKFLPFASCPCTMRFLLAKNSITVLIANEKLNWYCRDIAQTSKLSQIDAKINLGQGKHSHEL